MSRKLKFRGIYPGDHHFERQMVYGTGVIIGEMDDKDFATIADEGNRMYWSVERATVGQFTGMQDKNGQDIFEGDIIEDDEHYYGEIYWSDKDAMWCVTDYGALCDYSGTSIKVIGNKHENPDFWNTAQE